MHHINNNGQYVLCVWHSYSGSFAYVFVLNRIHIVLFQTCFVFNITQLLSSLFILCMFFLSTNMYIWFCWCSNWRGHWIVRYVETTAPVTMYINNFYPNEWKSVTNYLQTLQFLHWRRNVNSNQRNSSLRINIKITSNYSIFVIVLTYSWIVNAIYVWKNYTLHLLHSPLVSSSTLKNINAIIHTKRTMIWKKKLSFKFSRLVSSFPYLI